jgi:hypothetical protein
VFGAKEKDLSANVTVIEFYGLILKITPHFFFFFFASSLIKPKPAQKKGKSLKWKII